MGYDYEKTSISLYRAIFKENFDSDVSGYLKPDAELANAEEIAPILHPTFEEAEGGGGHRRPPDIVVNKKSGMYDPDTGGTSVFDRPGVLSAADLPLTTPYGAFD